MTGRDVPGGRPPGSPEDEVARLLQGYAAEHAAWPRTDLAARIMQRIEAEPRDTATRRFATALVALDLRASRRAFGQILAAALGRVPVPAMMRLQALTVVLLTFAVVGGGGAAGMVGAGLLVSEWRSEPRPEPSIPAPEPSPSPSPTVSLEPLPSVELLPTVEAPPPVSQARSTPAPRNTPATTRTEKPRKQPATPAPRNVTKPRTDDDDARDDRPRDRTVKQDDRDADDRDADDRDADDRDADDRDEPDAEPDAD